MKITKSILKQIIKEELSSVLEHEAPGELERIEEPEPKDMPEPETLLDKLEYLLRNWPACDEDPEGAACQYHKDLEEVVKQYGRPCGADNEVDGGFSGAVTAEPAAIEEG